MRAVVQRVTHAAVRVEGGTVGKIGPGLLIFLGVEKEDTDEDLDWLVRKTPQIRCFEDVEGKMNNSLLDIDGEALVISQFTVYGNLRKGSRPSFNRAALPDKAVPMYEAFAAALSEKLQKDVPTGRFAQHMDIEAHNDGPVTLILDSKNKHL